METIQIFLNSKNAQKYINNQTANTLFHLPHINVRKSKNITITVLNAQIPISFYNVNSNNNTLVFSENNGLMKTVYFTPANYNINTLKSHIVSLMGSNFTITYSSSSNKITIVNSINNFEIYDSSTCFELIGFQKMNHSSISKTLTSDNIVNLFTVRNLQISSDNFILNNIDASNPNVSNILASIPISTSYNSVLTYNNIHDVHSEINNTRNLTSLHIQLNDQDGNVIELNNSHWSMTLLLSIK